MQIFQDDYTRNFTCSIATQQGFAGMTNKLPNFFTTRSIDPIEMTISLKIRDIITLLLVSTLMW